MSHFTVAVIHREDQDIADLLAPYSEGMEVEEYVYRTKEEIIESAKRHQAHYLERLEDDEECYNKEPMRHWIEPFINAKNDEELYLAEVQEFELVLDENGNELSTYNPNSKWDWWQMGGRFGGLLRLKENAPEWMGDYCNSAPLKYIDFECDKEMYKEEYEWWEKHVNAPDEEWTGIFKKTCYTDYYKNAEEYAKRRSMFSTLAVVTPDGVWHERGEVGYFGAINDTPETARDWDLNYKKNFIDTADPDYIMTIVDCHI